VHHASVSHVMGRRDPWFESNRAYQFLAGYSE